MTLPTAASSSVSARGHELLASALRVEVERLLADGQCVALVVEAPSITPELLTSHELKLAPDLHPSTFWHTSTPSPVGSDVPFLRCDETVVGLGIYREVSAPWGNTEVVRGLADDQLGQFRVVGPGARAFTPRLFAALGFAPRRETEASPDVWADLGGGAVAVIPRLTYVLRRSRDGHAAHQEAWFCLTLSAADQSELDGWLGQIAALTRRLRSSNMSEGLPAISTAAPAETGHAAWQNWVEHALGDIGAGKLEKVVAARRAQFTFDNPLSPAHTLLSLGHRHSDSTRFAFFRGGSVFLGATPERLIAKRGSAIETEALAGTVRRSEASSAQDSTHDFGPKEHKEHAPVLAQILATLAPFCTAITHDPTPQLRAQRQVLHLRSSVQARLQAPYHVLSLVQALHPTPAVGGRPTKDALTWITRHEDFDRGLYAGPVGWVDADGDGQFNVALRSGVMRGNQATLFAGAGIVAGSDAQKEFDETALKLQVLLESLCHGPVSTSR